MKKIFIIILLSSGLLISCGKQDEKKMEADFYAKKPEYAQLQALASKNAVVALKKPRTFKQHETKTETQHQDELFRLTEDNILIRQNKIFKTKLVEIKGSELVFSDKLVLSFMLPDRHKLLIKKDDEAEIRYGYKFLGLELKSSQVLTKENLQLALVHDGGEGPVSFTTGTLIIRQTKEEKIITSTPSETYFGVAVEVLAEDQRPVKLQKGKATAVKTARGSFLITLINSKHTVPKETGSSFEAPPYEIEFVVTREE